MIEIEDGVVILECRSTGYGALTTLECFDQMPKRFAKSRTGNHWRESLAVTDGEEFIMMDITNSGKHHCCHYRVENDHLKIVARADPMKPECPICDPYLLR